MRTSTIIAPLFFAASSLAQAVEEGIAPDAAAPEGCQTTVQTPFRIGTLENPTLSRRETAQEASDGDLLCTLEDGILHDQYGRTGSIVANQQFQFDGPPQAGAIYTGGFSVCGNDSLAIGGSTRWWRCMSGAFGNLYDSWIGDQCHEIRIQAIYDESASSASSSSASASASGSGSEAMSSTTSAALSGSTSIISASETSGLTSESRSISMTGSGFSTSATGTGANSPEASETGDAAAPPADGAASSISMASFAMVGASMVFLGAALIL